MDVSALTEWLKTTVPGIVLLGALGSIASVAILKFVGPPLGSLVFRPLRYVAKERLWRFWRSSAAYSHIEEDSTNRKLIYYLFYHLSRLVVALVCVVVSAVVLAIVVTSRSEVLLTYGTFVLSTVAFVSAYWAWTEYENITINFIIEWRKTGIVKDPFPDIDDLTETEKAALEHSKRGPDA